MKEKHPLEWRIFRARCFIAIVWEVKEMDQLEQLMLAELLTGDWDGRGLAGKVGRKMLQLLREFEEGWLHDHDEKVWDHRVPPDGRSA